MVCITFIKTEELNTFQGADHSSNDYPADERDHVPRDSLYFNQYLLVFVP